MKIRLFDRCLSVIVVASVSQAVACQAQSNIQTAAAPDQRGVQESDLPTVETELTDLIDGTLDAESSVRTVDVVAAQTSHGYDGWVNTSPMPSVWIDLGVGPATIQSIRITLTDPRAQAHTIQTLAALSLVVEADSWKTIAVPLIDIVPGRGDVVGDWPVTFDHDTHTMTLTVKMPYEMSMRVGLQNSAKRPVGVSLAIMGSDELKGDAGYLHILSTASEGNRASSKEQKLVVHGSGALVGVQAINAQTLDDVWVQHGDDAHARALADKQTELPMHAQTNTHVIDFRHTLRLFTRKGSGWPSAVPFQAVVICYVDDPSVQ